MKKIIGLILIMLMLSGCGLYDLNSFVIPDDTEFIKVIKNLDTPEKIGNYMVENFKYDGKYIWKTLSPYQLWEIKKGACADFTRFGMFVANYHGYKTYRVEIYYKGLVNHMIAVYQEGNGYTFSSNRKYYRDPKNSFKECIMSDYIKYKVFDYKGNLIEAGE